MEYQRVPLTCDPLLKGYEIDTNGTVFGKKGQPLNPSYPRHGYLVNFSVLGKSVTRQVHRLVAKQFIPNPNNKPTVNHKDGNPRNNNVDNLEWATYKEQMVHARDVLGIKPINMLPIVGMNIKTRETIECESCAAAARIFKKRKCTFDFVVNGLKPSCAGFVWIKDTGNKETNILLLEEKIKHLKPRCLGRTIGMYSCEGELIKTYKNAYATRLDGFSHQAVYRCCSKSPHYESQKHKGYVWRFLD